MGKVYEDLQARASRRGFLATVARVTLGTVAVLSGVEAIGATPALASGCDLLCCFGGACSSCSCPSGTSVQYQWRCCQPGYCTYIECYDCYNGSNQLVCVYSSIGTVQACGPC